MHPSTRRHAIEILHLGIKTREPPTRVSQKSSKSQVCAVKYKKFHDQISMNERSHIRLLRSVVTRNTANFQTLQNLIKLFNVRAPFTKWNASAHFVSKNNVSERTR